MRKRHYSKCPLLGGRPDESECHKSVFDKICDYSAEGI